MTSPLEKTADACKRVSHRTQRPTSTLVTPKPLPWTSASLNALEECAISVWTTQPTKGRPRICRSHQARHRMVRPKWDNIYYASDYFQDSRTLPLRSSNKVALMSTNKAANRLQLKRELPLVLVQKAPIAIVQWKNRFVF